MFSWITCFILNVCLIIIVYIKYKNDIQSISEFFYFVILKAYLALKVS